jgi:hypothetical protein
VRACANACVRPCSRACSRAHMHAHVRAHVVCRCAPISPHAPQSPHMHPILPSLLRVCGWRSSGPYPTSS